MDEDMTRAPQRVHSRTKSNTESIGSINNAPRPRHLRTKSSKKIDSVFSDDATTAFIRRTLCVQHLRSGTAPEGAPRGRTTLQPLTELLPPLTSSSQLDLQLYALIAIIIKDFVQSWYSQITPDQEFTDQVVQIIAHCCRALEQRIRSVDLEALILDELPELVDIHVTAYRTAYNTSYTSSLVSNPRGIYHAIHPHPALSPVPLEPASPDFLEQAGNEAVWRQLLVQGALSHLLPPEDLENPCLRVLVTEIFSELILGRGVCGNVCEGWFVWEVTTKLLAILRPPEPEVHPPSPSRLEKFGLLSDQSTEQTGLDRGPLDVIFQILSQIIQYSFLVFLATRSFISALSASKSLPIRKSNMKDATPDAVDGLPRHHPTRNDTKRPILAMSVWSCCSHFLSLDLRLPWLTGMCAFIQWLFIFGPGKVGYSNGRLDRLLSHHIRTSMLDPNRLPSILLLIRTNMFPNNSLGPGRVPPTAAEILEIRRQCAITIAAALPSFVRDKLFSTREAGDVHLQVEDMLDVFGDAYLNKHLIVSIVDLVFLRLFPEMQDQGVEALLRKGD